MNNDTMPPRAPRATVVLVAMALMAILVLSVGSSAFATSNILGAVSGRPQLAAEHHKPGHDNGGGNGSFSNGENEEGEENGNHGKGNGGKESESEKGSMLQPVPSSLDNFELSVKGIALAKRDGRDGPFADAEVNLHATILREEGNHLRFQATGTVDVDSDGEYDIVDAQGIVIFFKNLRGQSVTGLMHIVGAWLPTLLLLLLLMPSPIFATEVKITATIMAEAIPNFRALFTICVADECNLNNTSRIMQILHVVCWNAALVQ